MGVCCLMQAVKGSLNPKRLSEVPFVLYPSAVFPIGRTSASLVSWPEVEAKQHKWGLRNWELRNVSIPQTWHEAPWEALSCCCRELMKAPTPYQGSTGTPGTTGDRGAASVERIVGILSGSAFKVYIFKLWYIMILVLQAKLLKWISAYFHSL